MQDIIKKDELSYIKTFKTFVNNFSENYLPIAFLIDIHKVYLPLNDGDDEQTNFAAKVKNFDKS